MNRSHMLMVKNAIHIFYVFLKVCIRGGEGEGRKLREADSVGDREGLREADSVEDREGMRD